MSGMEITGVWIEEAAEIPQHLLKTGFLSEEKTVALSIDEARDRLPDVHPLTGEKYRPSFVGKNVQFTLPTDDPAMNALFVCREALKRLKASERSAVLAFLGQLNAE